MRKEERAGMNAEKSSLVPSFVVFHVGARRVALSRDIVAELIASPFLYSFPHTTPLIASVTSCGEVELFRCWIWDPASWALRHPRRDFSWLWKGASRTFPRDARSRFKGNANWWPESCSPRPGTTNL